MQGDTYEEVLENIKDAIHLHIEDRIESGMVLKSILNDADLTVEEFKELL